MKIDILTLFPAMFEGFLNDSIIKRARERKLVEINVHDIRNFTLDKNKKVDDYGYGGGKGMVLMPEPVVRAIEEYKTIDTTVILMCPQGEKYTEKKAFDLSLKKHIILVCGHYEGYDERIRNFVDMEISIGDYILTGGELPAMVITDSITRLIDGVIEKESYENESFNNNLLDYPVYTRPQEFRGLKVPEVLLSGHHENINKWRLNESIKRTKIRRPDLLKEDD